MSGLNDVWGEPTFYKKVKLYPIKLDDQDKFYNYIGCLLIEKNKYPDVQIIKMSYLVFLIWLGHYHPEIIDSLYKLLNLVFQDQKWEIKIDEKDNIYLDVNSISLSENDFDKIRKIIFRQNLIYHDDIVLDPELEQKLKEAEEFMNRKNGKVATLEERIISYHVATGIEYEKIRNYTIYQFNKGLERLSLIKNFEVYTYPMLKSGEPDKIQHWLMHVEEKSKYGHILMDRKDFNKITNDNGILIK